MHRLIRTAGLLGAVASLAVVAGCGGDDSSSSSAAPASTQASTTSSSSATNLAGVCPAKVVVQTDWNPESDHSELYEMAATGGDIDTAKKRYTADLITHGGEKTGVQIEIRVGGPAIGFQQVTAQMYTDSSILLGYVNTDEAIQNSGKKPTVAVVAPRENWAQILMYDPTKYDFSSIADIGKTNTKVLYFQGAAYMAYLTGQGILKKSQVDGSYDGKPARFVTSGGKVVQQGFITAEPYQYEHEIKQWGKPVKSLLIQDAGYPNYGEAIAVKPDAITSQAACLKKLVPIIQQAQVDYAADPERANALIADLVPKFNTGWVYPKALADYAAKAQLDNKIISNGDDDTLGNLDEARVQKMIDVDTPIYQKQNIKLKTGLKPSDLFTNEFIKTGIGIPAG
jgi:hypothetical protein